MNQLFKVPFLKAGIEVITPDTEERAYQLILYRRYWILQIEQGSSRNMI